MAFLIEKLHGAIVDNLRLVVIILGLRFFIKAFVVKVALNIINLYAVATGRHALNLVLITKGSILLS